MSSDERTERSAHAIVVVELEIDVHSSWGGECAMDQVYKQAVDDAQNSIRFLFQEAQKQTPRCGHGIRVRGIPKVTAIVTERSRS